MAMYKSSIDKLQEELRLRYQTLQELIGGTSMTDEQRRLHQPWVLRLRDEPLRTHDPMAIRLAINDFKGILAEIARIK